MPNTLKRLDLNSPDYLDLPGCLGFSQVLGFLLITPTSFNYEVKAIFNTLNIVALWGPWPS